MTQCNQDNCVTRHFLFVRSFWDRTLNESLLVKNKYNMANTIDDLLKIKKPEATSTDTSAEQPIVRQPATNPDPFVCDFD